MKKINILVFILFFVGFRIFPDEFLFSGDKMQTVFARGKERTVLTGNAKIETEDTVITADLIELYGEDSRFSYCTGNIRIVNTDEGVEITCSKLFYDRTLKIMRVTGNAVMVNKNKGLVVKAGYIENRDKDDQKISIIQIGVRILKEDMVCRCEFARYLRDQDKLELSGMPFVYWKGDEYRATKIYIDLDKDEIRLEGDVKGAVITDDKEEESEEGGQDKSSVSETEEEPAKEEEDKIVPEQGDTVE